VDATLFYQGFKHRIASVFVELDADLRPKDLGDPLLAEIAALFVTERHPAGRTIIHQGNEGDRFYICVRGEAEVFVDEQGGERAIATVEDGDPFGEIALISDRPRTASVRTTAPSTFLTLTRDQFRSVLRRSPELRSRIESLRDERLRQRGDLRQYPTPGDL
jgi:ATP-binding cassette subfamily B protein